MTEQEPTPAVFEQINGALTQLGPDALSPTAQQEVERLMDMDAKTDRLRAIFNAEIGTTLSADEQVLLDQMCLAYKRSIAHKSPRQMDAGSKANLSQAASRLTDKIKLAMLPGRFTDSDEEVDP